MTACLAMAGSDIRSVIVDAWNRFLRICGDFVVDFEESGVQTLDRLAFCETQLASRVPTGIN
jgi:hypothetical protein